MGTDAREDLDALEELDFPVICKPWSIVCGVTATWVYIKRCCGFEIFVCDVHREVVQEHIEELDGDQAFCLVCGKLHVYKRGRWVKL
jgi:hypothetical protein